MRDIKIDVTSDTLVEMEARKVVNIWAETVARVEERRVNDTLGQLDAE